MSQPRPAGSRRRVAVPRERSVSPLTLLAFVLPLLTAGALALVHPPDTAVEVRPPAEAPVTRTTVVCPDGPLGRGTARLALPDHRASGELRLRAPRGSETLAAGEVLTLDRPGLVVADGTGEVAPGLTGLRAGGRDAVSCSSPRPEWWFAGAGAGAEHRSVLQLVNPDGGAAVADITVWGDSGRVEAEDLRGVLVRGRRQVDLDLASLVPRPEDLTLRVEVSRGRLAASVLHRFDEIGSNVEDEEWLPATRPPATTTYLPAPGTGSGDRVLVLTNPGEDQTTARIRLVTGETEFEPSGVEEIVVQPESTVVRPVGELLASEAAEGTVALRVDSEAPVVAGLRGVVGQDLVAVAATDPLEGPAGTVVPPGPARLVLAGSAEQTRVRLEPRAADGTRLDPLRVRLPAGAGRSVRLPARARWVGIDPGRSAVHAGLATDGSVVPVPVPVAVRLVPDVRPALH